MWVFARISAIVQTQTKRSFELCTPSEGKYVFWRVILEVVCILDLLEETSSISGSRRPYFNNPPREVLLLYSPLVSKMAGTLGLNGF